MEPGLIIRSAPKACVLSTVLSCIVVLLEPQSNSYSCSWFSCKKNDIRIVHNFCYGAGTKNSQDFISILICANGITLITSVNCQISTWFFFFVFFFNFYFVLFHFVDEKTETQGN